MGSLLAVKMGQVTHHLSSLFFDDNHQVEEWSAAVVQCKDVWAD